MSSWLPRLTFSFVVSSGHLVMDLNHMLRPAKSPQKCDLQLLDQPADKLVSLFEQKTVKGWWPCTCEKDGEKIIAVRRETHWKQTIRLRGTISVRRLFCVCVSGEGGDVSGDRDGAGARGATGRTRQRWTQHEPSPGGTSVRRTHTTTNTHHSSKHTTSKPPSTLLPLRRPETSFLWFSSPYKTLKFILWRRFKWFIILFIILFFILLFLGIFLYSFPASLSSRDLKKNQIAKRGENNLLCLFFFFSFLILQNYAAMKMVGPFGPAKKEWWWRRGGKTWTSSFPPSRSSLLNLFCRSCSLKDELVNLIRLSWLAAAAARGSQMWRLCAFVCECVSVCAFTVRCALHCPLVHQRLRHRASSCREETRRQTPP